MKTLHSLGILVIFSTFAYCAPPKFEMPNNGKLYANSSWVDVVPTTDAVKVTYVGLSGLDPFPSAALKDDKRFILSTQGLGKGSYDFIAFASKKDEHTVYRFKVLVGDNEVDPTPIDPKPDDSKPDDPKLDDAPVPDNDLYILMVYESGKSVTPGHFETMYSVKSRKLLDNTTKKFVLYDQDQKPNEQPWKDAIARQRKDIPWIVVIHNKKYVYEGILPSGYEALKSLVEKYVKVENKQSWNIQPTYQFPLQYSAPLNTLCPT